jgi:hypothetical protein
METGGFAYSVMKISEMFMKQIHVVQARVGGGVSAKLIC